jgi:vacuolar-type H+-ATPase subunit F/Vma7
MSRAAVIGEAARTGGFVLAGALVFPAEDAGQAHAAWHSLPQDVAVVVLTSRAANWLGDATQSRPGVLLTVMRGDGA